ncbi:MAG: chloride channel protein [Porticoccaceae bacterium]
MAFEKQQQNWLARQLDQFRARLAHADALPQLAILGCISGLITGLIAIAFRLSFELPLTLLLPDGSESFEALGPETRFLLPVLGALVVGLIVHRCKPEQRSVGVGHVLDRMQHHQAQLPAANGLLQFVGTALLLMSGNSVGREGPAIHLGATSSSLLGQWMRLPNNSLRTLTGCGVAAAIAASFNTPLAGVIFAMEVVLMEYTITGFIPVILAAVAGGVLSRIVFGAQPAFTIPLIDMASLWELPYLLVCGLAIGLASAGMLLVYRASGRFTRYPLLLRFLFAGLLCGAIAIVLPQIQGVGYDTVEQALTGELALGLLLAIAAAKILVSSISIGLGMPGGIIGPNFVIGACLGGALGIIGSLLQPGQAGSPGFYAMMGMGAMMSAVLNAPLAALIAVLELTYNPNILLPSMLVIVIANITCRMLTKLPGIFSIDRDLRGYDSPLFQLLSRAGVTSLMRRNFMHHSRLITLEKARILLAEKPDWIVIEDVGEPKYILRPADLARHLEELAATTAELEDVDLREIPGERWRLFPVHDRATLQEALLTMQQNNAQAVYIGRPAAPLMSEVAGIITRQDIDNFYQ